jgi:hypothetical protein
MASLRRAVVLLLLAAGCKSPPSNGFAVDVTVRSSQLASAVAAQIRSLDITVDGAESWTGTYPIATQFSSGGEVRWIYRPGASTRGALNFAFLARDGAMGPVAYGTGQVTLAAGETKTLTVLLGSNVPDLGPPPGADMAMLPPAKATGSACQPGIDRCESGNCVDGFCCDKACSDPCLTCKLPGQAGTCLPVPAGQKPTHMSCPFRSPNDPTAKCSYDGTCDGQGACRLYPKDTPCSSSSCTGNTFTPPSLCDGKGTCTQPAGFDCTPFRCKDDASCFEPPCTNNTQCYTLGPVYSCDPTTGSCGPLPNGRKCTKNEQCTSTHCVDGYCCDVACTGQCEACDILSQPGKCSPSPAGDTPHGARTPCSGSGGAACGGTCDGNNRAACGYPAMGKPCADRSCSGNMYVPTPTCNGNGSCITATAAPCPSAPNASGVCKDQYDCTLSCAAGYADCDMMTGNGCESMPASDDKNCGACGNDCTKKGQVCVAGPKCQCAAGKYVCDSDCVSTSLCCAPTDAPCSCTATSTSGCVAAAQRAAFNCSSQTFTFVGSQWSNCFYSGSAGKYCCQ